MIKLTEQAAKQIIDSAEQGKMQGIPLRLAIKEQDDGSFHYAMGFDEQRLPGDIFVNIEEISMVVSAISKDLAEGMTIDYVELEPGKSEFIFLNPNDPTYVPPR
ncbi:MAG: Fe-S cluster assembly protein HesB [Gammaproteobacteria bacterium]|nr:Fe-S cluster assembly protein HesB [Gammaproteobacteria bacterium]MCZ6669234.1 Fe-S cluster assembly protein HesB [Gammaproteobacteria bacterium]MCZ6723554.1 Fe-S cluster assembly protein HesB [Gammaproteobacteria bacterium]